MTLDAIATRLVCTLAEIAMCESKRQPHGSAVCYVVQRSTKRCSVESVASAKIIAIGLFAMLVLVALLPTRHFVRVATCWGGRRGVSISQNRSD